MPTVLDRRSSGVLLHLTSLPGPYLSGDLGLEAHSFLKQLKSMDQSWWQMLPVNPIGKGNSPYSSICSFAGEPLLISIDLMVRDGLLSKADIKTPPKTIGSRLSFTKSKKYRDQLLKIAYKKAKNRRNYFESPKYRAFERKQSYWLKDFALFSTLTKKYKTNDWTKWPEDLKLRSPKALSNAMAVHEDEIQYHKFLQFQFDNQWSTLRKKAKESGIKLMGDIPIFISFESSDAWSNSQLFLLDRYLQPKVVAGCPPDKFCKDGQLWGNALYNWPAMKKENFNWWVNRLKRLLGQFDGVRLDHFIGFYRFWSIPSKAKTAKSGKWSKALGDDFFKTCTKELKSLPFLAEDLGPVTPPVRALRDKYSFPGMKVVQFGFGTCKESLAHRPHTYNEASVVYTGTHDNDTAIGWFKQLKKDGGETYENAIATYGRNPSEINWVPPMYLLQPLRS